MRDYQANSDKSKKSQGGGDEKPPVDKEVKKIVTGEVVAQKKGPLRKFKEIFVSPDAKGVVRYVTMDVLLPAGRDMVFDAIYKGVGRMMYGERGAPRNGRPGAHGSGHVAYYRHGDRGLPRSFGDRQRQTRGFASQPSRQSQDDFILADREDAEGVLDQMNTIIDQYGSCSVADLNELVGWPVEHTDHAWGWTYLINTRVRQVRQGYLIDLPPAEPIPTS